MVSSSLQKCGYHLNDRLLNHQICEGMELNPLTILVYDRQPCNLGTWHTSWLLIFLKKFLETRGDTHLTHGMGDSLDPVGSELKGTGWLCGRLHGGEWCRSRDDE